MSWLNGLIATFLMSFLSASLYLNRIRRNKSPQKFWTTLPSVGVDEGAWFAWSRAVLLSITKSGCNALQGYQDFSHHGIPFVITSTGSGAIVVLPPSQLHILNKSESQVLALQTQMESHQPRYTMGDLPVYEDMIHFDLVRNQLTKNVGFFVSMTQEELNAAFDDYLGTNSREWNTVNLWELCTKAIARAGNRAYVGLPLCRDEMLLEQTRLYATAVYGSATIINALPPFLRPILGPLVALPAKRYLAGCKKILVPFVEERLQNLKHSGEKGPDDVLQWLIFRCAKAGPGQLDASKITERLLILNLVSIYTTTYAFAYCILDLYGSPSRDDFISGLRSECQHISSRHDGLKTKEAIDKLFRIDSTVRESMRISAFGTISLPRIVAPGTELDLGKGIKVPSGVRMGIPCQAIHLDASRHENPLEFDAFRFSRSFEGPQKKHQQATEQKLSVTIDESFLTYGYGKHGCPGRWFASQMMKQALAHVVLNYDIECVGEPPNKTVLLNMVLPPTGAKVRIRRRP
ncbi:cytochrome P450 [Massariosphaeria phaeospora]|uniref:Cytochrome P450 n=1 Tax=Massariosphaeria phaeospora TaxID=100035 RepID=A0A7C8M4J5_9PLEO|nr:cytochrome P450 [Massariosphaeria phaeospora]